MRGQRPPAPAVIDSFSGQWGFLSNFHSCRIVWEQPPHGDGQPELVYPSLEHAFQAAKSLDLGIRWKISQAATPQIAKHAGRGLKLRPGWDDFTRVQVMGELIRQKFAPGSDLARRLVETDPARLVEGNTWHDNFWGDCRCGTFACRKPGENYLGETLMMWRAHLIRTGGSIR